MTSIPQPFTNFRRKLLRIITRMTQPPEFWLSVQLNGAARGGDEEFVHLALERRHENYLTQ